MKWLTTKVLLWALVAVVLAGLGAVGIQQLRIGELRVELANAKAGQSRVQGELEQERAGRAEDRAGWAEELERQASAHARDQAQAREKERLMQLAADKLRNDAYAQISRLTRARDAALDELRNRPERPPTATVTADGVPPTSSSPSGCTGAGLYRADAEFLVRFAASAKQLGIERDTCYRQYPGAAQ